MGVTGPIPKRSDEVVRRNKPDVPITKVEAIGVVPIPDLDMPSAHQLVKDLYQSLRDSAQSKYYEPSDWQMARTTFFFLDELLKSEYKSAMMLSTIHAMMTPLLMTEGDRRRVRMEVDRNQAAGDLIDVADLFRQKLEQRN